MIRCARDSRDPTVSADDVGREHGDRSSSPAVAGGAQELPDLSGLHFLYFCQRRGCCFAVYRLPPLGIFLNSFLAHRMGNAGGNGLRAGLGSD